MNEFTDNLFEVDRPEDIPLDSLYDAMKRRTFACIRGIVPEAEVRHALDVINERFDHRKDHPPRGQPASAVRTNFQKLNVGGESTTASNDDARLFRAFYNPFWEEDVWALRGALTALAKTRNVIAALPPEFAMNGIEENGLWTAARWHQYPAGGGTMPPVPSTGSPMKAATDSVTCFSNSRSRICLPTRQASPTGKRAA